MEGALARGALAAGDVDGAALGLVAVLALHGEPEADGRHILRADAGRRAHHV